MQGPTPHEQDLRDAPDLAEVLGQLARGMAFLRTRRPPVSRHYPIWIGFCAASTAEVDEAAAAIGVTARWTEDGTQYIAEKPLGTSVCYRATYLPALAQKKAA